MEFKKEDIALIESKLTDVLRVRTNVGYCVTVNYNLLKYDIPNTRNSVEAVVKYVYDNDNKGLVYGYYALDANKKRKFYISNDIKILILTNILTNEVCGYNFKEYVGEEVIPEIDITADAEVKILDIKTLLFKNIFNEIYTKNMNDIALSFPKTNRKIYGGTDGDFILSYKNLMDNYFIGQYFRTLTEFALPKIQSGAANILKMYNLKWENHTIFIPVFLKSKWIFNPFLESPRLKERILTSKLYTSSKMVEKTYKGITINYLTSKQICECLNIPRFIYINPMFLIKILSGIIIPDNPNYPSTMEFYVKDVENTSNTLPAMLTINQYMKAINVATDEEKSLLASVYHRTSSMHNFCAEFANVVGYPVKDERLDTPRNIENLLRNLSDIRLLRG